MDKENLIVLEELGLSEAELFATVDHDALESERITAPRYSYWRSVFRVFFKKKLNIIILSLLGLLILFAYVYPLVIGYDPDDFYQVMDSSAKNLTPAKALAKFGFGLKWLLGTGTYGGSTFDAVWYGSSISISLALLCAAINMTVGVLVGAVWGFSRKVDIFMTEVYNIIANIPYILLVSVFILIMSAGFFSMVFAMTS